ncbi:MAG: hypothetical protein MUF36_01010 [Bacteroidales bacterium]|jgi:hypothetical protein|nr:hypothetical protein [Bacteroidales bacterium]
MSSDQYSEKVNRKTMVWFFAGGETDDNKFNVFTGSFIRLMKEIMGNEFELIKGVYFKTSIMNVAWALNHSQKPIMNPGRNRITDRAFNQLISYGYTPDTQMIMVSSSSGSVVAAQTACYLAEKNREKLLFKKPFHLALGACMVSTESELFKLLKSYQKRGHLGKLVHDELQDEDDNANGVGSTTRFYAWMNALGLMMPWFSWKHSGPSFLNTHPVKGHLHRRRSQTVRKALDFIDVLLVKYNLAGDFYKEKAKEVISRECGE